MNIGFQSTFLKKIHKSGQYIASINAWTIIKLKSYCRSKVDNKVKFLLAISMANEFWKKVWWGKWGINYESTRYHEKKEVNGTIRCWEKGCQRKQVYVIKFTVPLELFTTTL
jgi:hypothetical protein